MIAVLPADVSDELLSDLGRELESQGVSVETSRGAEQVVLRLAGVRPGGAAALESVFAGRVDVDLIPILSASQYKGRQLRRRLASWMVVALGLLFTAALCLPVYLFLQPPHVQLVASDLVFGASALKMPPSSGKQVSIDDERVLLVRREDGSAFATSGHCTHLDGCLLEWSPARKQVVCPCCGGAFDAYGNVIEGPPSIPLRTYSVERIDDDLFIRRKE